MFKFRYLMHLPAQLGPVLAQCREPGLALRDAGLGLIDSGLVGRVSAKAEDAQGTPTQSHISPSIL